MFLAAGPSQRAVLDLRLGACRAEPVVTGQTAANSFKPAILENGVKVMVPPFIAQDEDIVVNTETMEYAERA